MKAFHWLLALAAVLLSGCSTTATVVPITGPLAKAGSPEIKVKILGVLSTNGRLEFTMPDGEQCRGTWQAMRLGGGRSQGAGTARGDRGSVFDLEFESDAMGRGMGKASDNRGNTYRVMVRGI